MKVRTRQIGVVWHTSLRTLDGCKYQIILDDISVTLSGRELGCMGYVSRTRLVITFHLFAGSWTLPSLLSELTCFLVCLVPSLADDLDRELYSTCMDSRTLLTKAGETSSIGLGETISPHYKHHSNDHVITVGGVSMEFTTLHPRCQVHMLGILSWYLPENDSGFDATIVHDLPMLPAYPSSQQSSRARLEYLPSKGNVTILSLNDWR